MNAGAAVGDLKGFQKTITPDYEGFLGNIRREGTPSRVYFAELFLDGEIQQALDRQFGITSHLDTGDPDYHVKYGIAMQRYLGYDYVRVGVDNVGMQFNHNRADDTAAEGTKRDARSWMDEHRGPIGSWEDFEKYPWPDPRNISTATAEKVSALVPDDMCLVGGGAHFCEHLVWLFGYEGLCYALYDDPELVDAVHAKLMEIETATWEALLTLDRVKIMWHSDDLGFKTGLLISPADTRRLVLSGHRKLAKMGHDAGRLAFLHACGKRTDIIEDLIEDVKFDAIHSFEDTIELVTDAKRAYGDRMALLGGIDVDFLCRADLPAIRARVRETLDVCQSGGGYALGSGNSVANYIPVESYLAMIDEGRLYGGTA